VNETQVAHYLHASHEGFGETAMTQSNYGNWRDKIMVPTLFSRFFANFGRLAEIHHIDTFQGGRPET